MKAIILAAGKGTRLYPVTLTMPKPLVPVANKALIKYAIETLTNMGATEIGLVVHSLDSPIRQALGDGLSTVGVPLTYIEQANPRGLAHAVKVAQPFLGDEPFLMYLGDNIFQDSMKALTTRFKETGAGAAIALTEVPDPTRFGIAELEGDHVKRLVEKPKDPPRNLCIVGVYAFGPEIFESIERTPPSARGEVEITDAIQGLIDAGLEVRKYEIEGWWKDTGKPEDVLDLIAEGRAAGVLLFEENLPSIDVGRTTTTAIQAAAARSPSGAPAIVAVDQEGGIVARVAGPPSSSASDMGTWPIASVEAEATAGSMSRRS